MTPHTSEIPGKSIKLAYMYVATGSNAHEYVERMLIGIRYQKEMYGTKKLVTFNRMIVLSGLITTIHSAD